MLKHRSGMDMIANRWNLSLFRGYMTSSYLQLWVCSQILAFLAALIDELPNAQVNKASSVNKGIV